MSTLWQIMRDNLSEVGVSFDEGLTDGEVERTEYRFGFRFAPDLKAFLQTGLPVGDYFPDWRSGDVDSLNDRLDRPRQGVLFDIEHNGFCCRNGDRVPTRWQRRASRPAG